MGKYLHTHVQLGKPTSFHPIVQSSMSVDDNEIRDQQKFENLQKLKVLELKSMLIERGISNFTSRTRKDELITMLESSVRGTTLPQIEGSSVLAQYKEKKESSTKQWIGGNGFGGSKLKADSPMALLIKFDPERKKHLLGPGGEMIKFIRTQFQCEVGE